MGQPKVDARAIHGNGGQPLASPDWRPIAHLQVIAKGDMSFEQLAAALQGGSCAPFPIKVTRADGAIWRGKAAEVDDSGIVRVLHLADNGRKPGTRFLLRMMEDGKLYGDFTD